jgi:hypothetical protein
MKKFILIAILAMIVVSCEKEQGFNVTLEATSQTPGFIINDGVNGEYCYHNVSSNHWSKSMTSENGNIYNLSAKSLDSNSVLTIKIKFNKSVVEYKTGKNYIQTSYVTFE